MQAITLEIRTENAAFEDGNYSTEIARILRMAANRIENTYHENDGISFHLVDSNGNKVGWCQNEL